MATYYIDLENPHYTSEVLSFYLWGQRTPPSRDEIADDKWIGRQEEIRLRADTQSLLDTVSPYVNIKDFKLTEVFFSGKTVLGNKLDANILSSVSQNSNGEYELTQEDFANLFYGEGHKDYDKAKVPSRSISLYNRGLNDEGYAKRAFVFGTVDVSVNTDNVRYILDKNLNPVRIENFDIKIKEDNFDFVGGDGSESINKVLNQVMDPSGIGKKVIIEIAEGAVIRNSSITKEDYLEIDNIEEYNNIFYDVLKAQKYYAEYGNIFASGVIDYLDKNGKLVIFGSNGEDTISGTKAKNFDFLSNIEMDWAPDWLANFILNHYKNNVDNGITYVGGNGNDKIGGTEHEDILLGGKGEDILKGEEGKDTLDGGEGSDRLEGGAGDDKYIANDGDTIMDDDKGEGKVQIKKGLTEYITLKGGEELKDKPNTYDGSNGETYTYDEKTKSLTVKLAGQTITIENFDKENEDGYLGIKLKDIAFVSLQYEGTDNDSIIFKAVISEALEYDLVISYDTKDIGAKQGVHYINTNGGHVTIKAGEKEATIKFDSLVDTKEIGCKEEISEEDKKKLDFNVILKNAEIKEEDANITVEINENDKEETGSVNEKVKQVCKCGENCSCGDGCKPPRKIRIDPIVLDMDKDQKISTVSLANSEVYFDINGDGLKERVSWIDSNEAFLVYDRNQDGKIDSINELFGNRDKNGFDELRETADSNYDNKIDKKDALYNRLQVWFDSNQNGKVDEGELKSLSEAGIKSINLNSTKTMIEIDGAVITDASKYIDESGNEQLMGDLLLEYLSQKEPEDTNYEIDFSTYSMVNMQGGGFVEQSFIAYNTNENFKRLVLEYEYDINKVMNNFDEFMAEWSGLYKAAEKLGIKKEDFSQDAVKSINVFKVWILERFWGRTDNLYSTEAAFKKNTNGNYKSIAFYEGEYIDAMYKSLVNRYQAIFALDTYYKDYFKECISFDTKSFHVYDNDKFNVLFADLANDKSVNDSYKYFLAKILNNINCSYINFNLDNALSFIEDENIRDNIQVILSSAKDSDFYFVNGADFTLNQNSTVFGNSKDDTINITSNGSYNTVFAGMGDDKIISKNSNDTYVYNLGNGNDIIYDIDGKDRILFGKGIAKDDINLQTKGSNLIISLKDGSSITIIDFKTLNNRIEELVFFDGSIIDLGSSNVLSMFATENNDVLEGGDTDDIIESLGGDDIIYANNGNDILVGGTGDDTLYGGYGDDTYIFNKGDGKDTISDTYGNDTLKFGEGITKEDLLSVVNGKDLVIYIKEDGKEYHESKDRIVIKNYVNSGLIENIFLSDGISVKLDELQKVTEGNDYLVYGNSGYIIDALGGNDTIITGSGNDTIYGGKGIDTIDSGDGNDTIYGGDGEDTINSGNGNDIIDGGSGNDTINAGSGNNILIGGKGDDTLNGGYDDDTYIFNRGDGRDIITDSYGTDTISFGENITKDDLIVRLSGNDLIIAIKEEGVEFNSLSDKITIKNYTTSYYKIENILFFDGSRLDTTTILYPTQNDDYLVYSDSAVTVDALDGDDIVITGSGNDTIYGSNGNDKLYGNGGNDVLDGGKGNDLLEGGLGGDTYMFGRGYGKDTVYDNGGYGYTQFNAGIDTLEFKGDIDKDDLWVKIIGKDLIIGIKEEGKSFNELKDVVTIKDYFNANNRIEVIKLGDDTIVKLDELQHGTEGNDNLIFDDENTMVHTLGGDDTVTTGAGDDEIHAGDGNDTVNSNAGNDLIYAGNGNDMVYAGSGNDIIYGENGDDIIYGEDGDDTLIGGAGSDILNGGSGDDTYIFNLADGKDTINDTYGNDTLLFGEGIAKNDIITKASNNDLILYIKEDGKDISQLSNSITIKNFFKSGYIENLELHDGTILKLDEIELGTDANDYLVYDNTASIVDAKGGNDTVVTGSKADVVYGGDGNDTINSNGGNDTVYGGAGNDIINSGTGDDVLFGGQGDDTIYGGLGDDTYVYNIGDGHDTINDEGENDRIIFGEGISKDDLIFKQTGYDLTLALKDGDKNFADLADSIKIVNYFKYQNSIETIIFDDGTTITNNDIAKLFANVSIKDTIFSEQGAVLRGGLGDDTYVYNRGDFTVVIDDFYSKNEIDVSAGNDTLMFGTEITKEDVTIGVNGDNLIIIINDNTGYEQLRDTVVIKDWKNENRGVEKIIFSDGEILLIDKNNAFPYIDFNNSTWTNNRYFIYGNDNDDVQGTSLDDIVKAEGGEDIIYTQNGNDIVYGGDGDDIIDTGVGNDRLIGGKGDDYLKGDAGNDTYIYSKGDGRDFIVDSAGNDVLYFDEGISRDDIAFKVYDNNLVIGIKEGSKSFFKLEDRIIIKDWYGAGRVEKIEFSDGTSLSASDIISAIGTDAGESIRGVDNAPNVINAYGGDDVIRGYNYDDILSGGSGNDTIYGGSGNDIIDGGIGQDMLFGEQGNDTYIFSKGMGHDTVVDNSGLDTIKMTGGLTSSDVVYWRENNDLLIGIKEYGKSIEELNDVIKVKDWYLSQQNRVEIVLFDNGEMLSSNEFLTATENNDNFTLGDENNDFHALSGNDTIYAQSGDDIIYGDDGNDIIYGENGNDTLHGGNNNDTLYGGNDNDTLYGDDGDDTLRGENGNDILDGGNDNDILYGGNGNDIIYGGDG
ncbi:MAG: hypothetical protein LBL65_08560, partial [Campylobacteraceae bacterium]|nr:hypothetical protein [Campylobacteraceae bacterium]